MNNLVTVAVYNYTIPNVALQHQNVIYVNRSVLTICFEILCNVHNGIVSGIGAIHKHSIHYL